MFMLCSVWKYLEWWGAVKYLVKIWKYFDDDLYSIIDAETMALEEGLHFEHRYGYHLAVLVKTLLHLPFGLHFVR